MWQYRLIERTDDDGQIVYALFKVYVDGTRLRMFEKFVIAKGANEIEIKAELQKMIEACDAGLYRMVGSDLKLI